MSARNEPRTGVPAAECPHDVLVKAAAQTGSPSAGSTDRREGRLPQPYDAAMQSKTRRPDGTFRCRHPNVPAGSRTKAETETSGPVVERRACPHDPERAFHLAPEQQAMDTRATSESYARSEERRVGKEG